MLHRNRAVLVVVDVQTKLLPSIDGADAMIEQIIRLVRGFHIVGAPILATEQYRKGLGETDRRIAEAISGAAPITGKPASFAPIEKTTMSCMLDEEFRASLERTGRDQIVLCGIESHVCVYQTAIHLSEANRHVEVAVDAVSSRSPVNRDVALQRMAAEGVGLTCVEMVVFEMLERCGTDEFRSWVDVIR